MLSRRNFIGAAAVGSYLALHPTSAFAQRVGKFSGNPVTESLGRLKRLVKPYSYRDPRGVLWSVPAKYKTNGASIPRILWSIAGGPFSGRHGDAAIIHDYYCDTMERSWQATHRVFYDAMISLGVGRVDAGSKYWAVRKFGPRWDSTHRWDPYNPFSRRRRGQKFSMKVGPDAKSQLANSVVEAQLLEHQQTEFAIAKSAIEAGDLGINEIEAIELSQTFDYSKQFNETQVLIDRFGTLTSEGQLLVPEQYMIAPEAQNIAPPGTDLEAILAETRGVG